MAGHVGALEVYIVVTGGDQEALAVPVWYRKGHAGSQWYEAGIDIPASFFPIHEVSLQFVCSWMSINLLLG